MFSKIIKVDIPSFPRSFVLLQQEALLANASLLSGFEYLVKANFDDKGVGAYYAAFFDLTIGFERIMKLAIIADHMVKNNFEPPSEKKIRAYGHDLLSLYNECLKMHADELILDDGSLDYRIVAFLKDFADAKIGRYYNISSFSNSSLEDPIETWERILNNVADQDLSTRIKQGIEARVLKHIIPALQLDDLTNGTGYIDGVCRYQRTKTVNHYALWRIINLLRPITGVLSSISTRCHEMETTITNTNFPSIPYFDEFFLFIYTDKPTVLRRKRWTDLLFL